MKEETKMAENLRTFHKNKIKNFKLKGGKILKTSGGKQWGKK